MTGASGGLATELEVLRRQVLATWAWLEETVSGVSADHANWWPLALQTRSARLISTS